MKNNRCFKLTALLFLAMIMVFSTFSALAEEGNDGADAQIGPVGNLVIYARDLRDGPFIKKDDIIMDGKTKVTLDKNADPNHSYVLKLEVSEPVGAADTEEMLPEDTDQVTMSYALPNVAIENGENGDVSWSYQNGAVIFKWVNGKKSSFSADITLTPAYPVNPAEQDLSGSYVLITKTNVMVGASNFNKGNRDRISSSKVSEKNGMIFPETEKRSVWTLKHVSGNYYTAYSENANKYMEIVLPNHATMKDRKEADAQKILVQKTADGYYTFQYQGVNLNNQGNNAANGFASYTAGNADNEKFKLRSPSEVINTDLLMFNVNGGTGDTNPEAIQAEAGSKVTLPGLAATKDGQNFLGWADVPNIFSTVPGTNHTYHEVYMPGTLYTVKAGMNTLYAVYNATNREVQFGIRADGVIVDEPNGNDVKDYKGHFKVKNILKEGHWVIDIDSTKPVNNYYVENNVTGALNWVPSAEEIANALKKEGNIDFNPETQYIHYYVLKYAGMWKVDGVIRNKQMVEVTYNFNVPSNEKTKIKNMPGGSQVVSGTEILVGQDNKTAKILRPYRDGFLFGGWNTEPDGSGTSYSEGHYVKLTENLNLYAQWIDISDGKMVIIIHSDWPDGKLGYIGAKITLTAELSGFTGRQYTLQWQYADGDSENWIDIPGANTDTYVFSLDEVNTHYNWRCVARDVR